MSISSLTYTQTNKEIDDKSKECVCLHGDVDIKINNMRRAIFDGAFNDSLTDV
jgi:hypothetical protein